jgi:hypothetical protein
MKQAGITLLIVGLLLTVFTSFSFFTKEKVVEIGDLKITKDEPHSINWSPLAGIAVMGLGGAMLWQSSKKEQSY